MGRGTETEVRMVFPIGAVVSGALPRFGEVADFVMIPAGCLGAVREHFKLPRLVLFFRCFVAACMHQFLVRRTLFQRQGIGAQMVNTRIEDIIQVVQPRSIAAERTAVNQVGIHRRETGLQQGIQRIEGFFGVMAAVHPTQFFVVQALQSQADAVHAGFKPGSSGSRIHIVRIGFQRKFRICFQGKDSAEFIQKVGQQRRLYDRRCATAEV